MRAAMTLSSDLLALVDAMDFFVVDAFGAVEVVEVESAADTSVLSVVDLLAADLLVVVVVAVLMTIVVFDF